MSKSKKRIKKLDPDFVKVFEGEEELTDSVDDKDSEKALFLKELEKMDVESIKKFKKVEKSKEIKKKASRPKKASSTSSQITATYDLHGMTLSEAEEFVASKINSLLSSQHKPFKVRIITGKGRHSEGNVGVLAQEVWGYVKGKFQPYIVSIDASPAEMVLGGKLIKGHFDVELKPKN